MKALIATLLLAAPAPSRDQILRDRARAQSQNRAGAAVPPADGEQVYSRPVGPPGATEALTGPLSFRFTTADGRVLTFSGQGTLTIETPQPQPVVTKLAGLRDPGTALLVNSAVSGQRLLLEGELLTGGTVQRVTVGGQIAAIARTTPAVIEFTVPTLPAGSTTVELYWLVNNQWQSKGKLPLVIRSSLPTPGPVVGERPRVDAFEDSAGQRRERFVINEPMVIRGSGFGSGPGKLWIGYAFLPVRSWTNERIVTESGPGANRFHPLTLSIWTREAGWVSGFVGPLVEEREER